MTRRQLPKVIRTNADDARIAASAAADEEAPAPRAAAAHDIFEAEPAPAAFARPAANDQDPTAAVDAVRQAARRRAAQRIVERHKTMAAVGGLFPLPVINVAAVTALILRMIKHLSDLYGLPFERERTRSTIIGLMGGAVPTGFATAAASTLVFLVPGSALVGLAVSALTAGALTRGIGLVFVEHFEATAMPPGAANIEHA